MLMLRGSAKLGNANGCSQPGRTRLPIMVWVIPVLDLNGITTFDASQKGSYRDEKLQHILSTHDDGGLSRVSSCKLVTRAAPNINL